VALVRPQPLARLDRPQADDLVLGRREEEVAVGVVLDDGEGALVALEENGALG